MNSPTSPPSTALNGGPARLPERLRQVVRASSPARVYSGLAAAVDSAYCLRSLGWREFLRLRACAAGPWRPASPACRFSLPTLQHPIHLRPGTTDARGLIYTAIREAYGSYLPTDPVRYIIDAGANIGDTTTWFLSRFPGATVVAVEPDEANFGMLRLNCEPYGARAVLIRGGVWSSDVALSLGGTGAQDAVRVEESRGREGACQGISMGRLMQEHQIAVIDLLKCDIEGAELELFSTNTDSWLPRTRFIVIETHGKECHDAVLAATDRHGFIHRVHRDLDIFLR